MLIFALAGLVISLALGSKKMKIIAIAIDGVLILAWLGAFVANEVDKSRLEEESYEYVINSGTIMGDICYQGNVDGYEIVSFGSMFSSDTFAVHENLVEVAPFCKVYKYVRVYSKKDTSILTGGPETRIKLSNGWMVYEADNILMLKPDLFNLVFMGAIYGIIALIIANTILGIITLVTRAKAKKRQN